MFDEMRECMMYMQQEYSTAEMPTDLVNRIKFIIIELNILFGI